MLNFYKNKLKAKNTSISFLRKVTSIKYYKQFVCVCVCERERERERERESHQLFFLEDSL
jgi:hypothetical protein